MNEQEIYIEAMSRKDPVDRSRFLDDACGDDDVLRNRLEKLIRRSKQVGSFLEHPPHPLAAVGEIPIVAEGPGTKIGPYKIREQIGEGGMGAVYVADQSEPVRRKVALKIIKAGMVTQDVVARFEAERQALAMMEHPNIAKVLDAGSTETGRPYFAMELVRGIPITEYAEQAKLSTQNRLDLFIKVCHAIQHAHQKGIIHRDIKPSNVLVTLHDGVPVPKVIDFGIAKATQRELTEKTIYTQFQQFIGTPAYMSPEQAEMSGLDIDTRSDIYSLGVLIYELLTGLTPFDAKELTRSGLDEMRKIICEREPLRPSSRLTQEWETVKNSGSTHSTLRAPVSAIDRDLDWIVMQCLEKDRTRRYATASDLAADLKRHLDNEPVVARPPSVAYRLQKAFQRNRIVFTAVAVVTASLVLGIGVSTWQALEARKSQEAAALQFQRASESELETRRLLYASDMMAAQQAWATANLRGVTELLCRYEDPGGGQEDLRGFTWYYLSRLSKRGLEAPTLEGKAGFVWCVAFSPDGNTIATGSNDGTVMVWDVETRMVRHRLTGDTRVTLSVSFSPDGGTLASAGSDGIKLWNPMTGALRRTVDGSGPVTSVAISSTGELLAGRLDGTAILCDLPSGNPRVIFGKSGGPRIWSVAFSPDGSQLVFGVEDGTVWLGDVNDLESWKPLKGHTSWARSVTFSPDGKYLASASHDHGVKLWDAATGEERFTRLHRDRAWSVAFSPDSKTLASTSNSVKLWDADTGRELDTLIGHEQFVYTVAFSPDGETLASGSHDTKVRLWDLNASAVRDTLTNHLGSVWDVAISSDGRIVASGSEDGTVKLCDVATGEELKTVGRHSNWVNCVAFSHDDKTLASAGSDGRIKLWDVESGEELNIRIKPLTEGVLDLAFSPDGTILASACHDRTVRLWDVQTGDQLNTFKGHSAIVWAVAFSPDGKTVASGSDDKTVKLWDVNSDREPTTLMGHTSVVNSVAFSPDGRTLASGSGDGTVKLWELEADPRTEPETLTGHAGKVWGVAFSPDGKTLASCSHDTTIRLWNLVARREPESLIGHSSAVHSVAFSANGSTLVSGSGDRTVKLWRQASTDYVD